MKVKVRGSNFSQFSDDMWLVAEHNGTCINFEVRQKELLSFAAHLIDIAIDCMRKSNQDTEVIEAIDDSLCEALTKLSNIND